MSRKLSIAVVLLLAYFGLVEPMALGAIATLPQLKTASPAISKKNLQNFQLRPRFNIWGFSGDRTLVEGQFLIPLYGNQERVLFGLIQGNYIKNDSSWQAGAGLGYRQIINNCILGGYAITDYVSTMHSGFTIINPGIEVLSNVWDFNINGYIPTTKNKKKLGKEDNGSGNFVIQLYEEAGWGVDFEVARTIPWIENAKIHLGAYYFDTKDAGSTNGIKARLTYMLNKYSAIEIQDYYDNTKKHNQFLVGVRFSLGGYSKEEKKQHGLAARLMDPIENIHVIANSSLNIVKKFPDEKKQHDNIWYFRPGDNSALQEGKGTIDDPFVNFNQANFELVDPQVGTTNQYPLMYFAPGSYSLTDFNSRNIDSRFELPGSWGMYGRIEGYSEPAMKNDRAEFLGGIDILNSPTKDPNILNSIQIINNIGGKGASYPALLEGMDNAALHVEGANSVVLQNINIENQDTYSNQGNIYVLGIYSKGSQLTFESLAPGQVDAQESSTITANASIATNSASPTSYATSYGISAYEDSVVNFNGGKNIIDAIGNGTNAYGTSYGINTNYSTVVNFTGGENTIKSTGYGKNSGIGNGAGYGITASYNSAINFTGGLNNIEVIGEGYAGTSSGNGSGKGIYLYASTVDFIGGENTIEVNGKGYAAATGYRAGFGEGIGIHVYSNWTVADHSVVNFIGGNNTIKATGIGSGTGSGVGYGVYADVTSTSYANSLVNFLGGSNTIEATGSLMDTGGTGKGYGIYMKNLSDTKSSLVNFSNSLDNIVNIKVFGATERYGIYADANSSIQRESNDITTWYELENYVDIISAMDSSIKGDMLRWVKSNPIRPEDIVQSW